MIRRAAVAEHSGLCTATPRPIAFTAKSGFHAFTGGRKKLLHPRFGDVIAAGQKPARPFWRFHSGTPVRSGNERRCGVWGVNERVYRFRVVVQDTVPCQDRGAREGLESRVFSYAS